MTSGQVILITVAIFALAAYLRLVNLGANPAWDGDEGYNWNITANLAAGHVRMFALQFAFVQHPPLFFLLGTAAFRLFGQDLAVLRTLAVVCGLAVVPLLVLAGRASGSTRAGLLAAGIFAVSPQIVIQNRFAYTYNLLMVLTFSVALLLLPLVAPRPADAVGSADGVWRTHRRALRAAALLTGLALTTDQEALYLLPALALVAVWRSRGQPDGSRVVAQVSSLVIIPPVLYIGWMMILRPAAFLFDLGHTAGRVGGGSPVLQLYLLAYNFVALLRFDVWLPLGLVGLLLTRRPQQRALLLFLLACMLVIILKVRNPNPLFRTAEPLWPFVALGLGLAAEAVALRLARTVAAVAPPSWNGKALGRAAAVLVLGPLAFVSTVDTLSQARTRLTPPIQSALPRSPTAARQMAAWINARAHPNDVVIAMPQVSWLLRCRTTELLQAVAITGAATAFYPAGLGPARWAYDVHLQSARYLVVDDFTRAWIAENSGERALVARARARWKVAYRGGEYTIYANPRFRRFRLASSRRAALAKSAFVQGERG